MSMLVAGALLVPASLGVMAFPGAASAATPAGSTTCTGISLKISGGKALLTLTKCGDTANTGGSGSLNAADLVPKGAQKVVFNWASKGTTSATMTVKVGGTKCAKGSTEYVASGKVTKDTGKASSIKVGNTVSAEICSTTAHVISFVKGTAFTI
ncbi:MAG: hypothetical protein ABSC41_00720 [Acidimicrobiales bacterium]